MMVMKMTMAMVMKMPMAMAMSVFTFTTCLESTWTRSRTGSLTIGHPAEMLVSGPSLKGRVHCLCDDAQLVRRTKWKGFYAIPGLAVKDDMPLSVIVDDHEDLGNAGWVFSFIIEFLGDPDPPGEIVPVG